MDEERKRNTREIFHFHFIDGYDISDISGSGYRSFPYPEVTAS